MKSTYNFINEENINPKKLIFMLQNIVDEVFKEGGNQHNIKVLFNYLDDNTPLATNQLSKEIIVNINFIDIINKNKSLFVMSFLHECRHIMQAIQYEREFDDINKFFLYIHNQGSSYLNPYDDLAHDLFYNEIDAHNYALNIMTALYYQTRDKKFIDYIDNYKSVVMQFNGKKENIQLYYDSNEKSDYCFNDKKKLMTIGQIELYKALEFRNQNQEGVAPLFLELTPNNNFHSMKKNIEFLQNNYNKYGLRLENVILHIEQNKIIEKQEMFKDIINLIQSYINPQNKVDFFEKLLLLKINKFITLENIEQDLDSIINYLKEICSDYYQTNINFYYYLVNILNYLISVREQNLLIKK